jgi:hypothetical protein
MMMMTTTTTCLELAPGALCCERRPKSESFALTAAFGHPTPTRHSYGPTQWEQVDDSAVEASGQRLALLYSTKVGEGGAKTDPCFVPVCPEGVCAFGAGSLSGSVSHSETRGRGGRHGCFGGPAGKYCVYVRCWANTA